MRIRCTTERNQLWLHAAYDRSSTWSLLQARPHVTQLLLIEHVYLSYLGSHQYSAQQVLLGRSGKISLTAQTGAARADCLYFHGAKAIATTQKQFLYKPHSSILSHCCAEFVSERCRPATVALSAFLQSFRHPFNNLPDPMLVLW